MIKINLRNIHEINGFLSKGGILSTSGMVDKYFYYLSIDLLYIETINILKY